MAATNLFLRGINVWHIQLLVESRHDDDRFDVLGGDAHDQYLRHMLRVHGADILKFQPDVIWDGGEDGQAAFLVQRAEETVSVVLINEQAGGVAQVILDYVTPRYRDFPLGEFVWCGSQILRSRGSRKR